MKRIIALIVIGLLAISGANEVYSQSRLERKAERAKSQSANKVIKTLKKEGWKLDDQTKSIDEAVLTHKVAMEKDANNEQIIGRVSGCKSRNVCYNAAVDNAVVAYAQLAKKSLMRGVVNSEVGNLGGEELDGFYAAYERLVAANIEGELKESFVLYKENGDGSKEYNVYFLVNEVSASQKRIKAMETALKESQIAQEYANRISEFVREKFDLE